jgi:hypothetical protein
MLRVRLVHLRGRCHTQSRPLRSNLRYPSGHAGKVVRHRETILIHSTKFRLAFFFLGILCWTNSNAQDYEIRLHRALNAGAKYRIVASGQAFERIGLFTGGKQFDQKEEDISFDVDATATALEVDPLGRPTQYTLEIEKFVASPDGGNRVTLERGTLITGRLEGQRFVLTADDTPLDALAAKTIGFLILAPTSTGTDDDVFGTRERKKVGDTWPINAEAAARYLGEMLKTRINSSNIKGETTLARAGRGAAGEVVMIGGTFSIDGFSMTLPGGEKILNGRMNASYQGQLPTDPRLLPLNTTMKIMTDIVGIRPAADNVPEITFRSMTEQYIARAFDLIN